MAAIDEPRRGAGYGRPDPLTVLGEAGWPLEWARLGRRGRTLAAQPRGHGEPVRVLPGLSASDASTTALRRYLRRLGYDARGWEQGRNTGEVPRLALATSVLVANDAGRTGERVHLVGWSLGGVIAREIARERPDLVAQVITFGSPVVGGPRFTSLARMFPREQVHEIEQAHRRAQRHPDHRPHHGHPQPPRRRRGVAGVRGFGEPPGGQRRSAQHPSGHGHRPRRVAHRGSAPGRGDTPEQNLAS